MTKILHVGNLTVTTVPSPQLAIHFDSAAVQIDTALYNHETETGTWPVIDVMPAMEGVKEPLPVGFWNADPLVADEANNFCFGTSDVQSDRFSGIRILYRVGQ
jgi:hypothetical protein